MSRRRSPLVLAANVALALALCSPTARANGRYPYAQQVLFAPDDSSRITLRTTYGILVSADRGTTWDYLCEAAVGYDATEDPTMAALPGGTLIAGGYGGLYVTHDGGCDWPLDDSIGARSVRDVTTERDARHALAVTWRDRDGGGREFLVFRSDDGGRHFAQAGAELPEDAMPMTLDVAPSDPRRLYVSATRLPSDGGAPEGELLVSSDGGATWEARPIPNLGADAPYIAAVDPARPDVLYVRVPGAPVSRGFVQSALLYTDDAGKSWREVFRANADMLGFALAPGGAVLLGLGGTFDSQRPVDPAVVGIYRASASDLAFERIFENHVGCLAYSGSTLYVCGTHVLDGFELGTSDDDGATVAPLLDYGGVRGPLACAKSSPQAIHCEQAWQYACGPIESCPREADSGAVPSPPTAPTTSTRGGCGCGGLGKSATPPPETGTARLQITPDTTELAGAIAAGVAALLARRTRRRR